MTAIHRVVGEYLAALAVEGKAERTLKVYGARLRRFADWCGDNGKTEPGTLSATDLRAYITHLQANGGGNGTPRQNAVVVKAFLKWLVAEGKVHNDPFAAVRLSRPSRKLPEPFSDEEVRLLLKATRSTRNPQRDKAIFLLLLDSGLRVSELARLEVERIHFENGTAAAKVLGKGGRERMVPIGREATRQLRRYLSDRRSGWLFSGRNGKPLGVRRLEYIIEECARLAGVNGKRCSPHTFRHTFARKYLLNGGDPFSLQQILGHSSLQTVRLYVNLWSTDVQAQHRKYSPADSLLRG
ncbi:MAG TPA: tyrosine-type recombinase/integrase [Dehalococcoidia bacterium]|nr:tyrosine-type recombinase/integrase [Dehalococcoidia bacterium]